MEHPHLANGSATSIDCCNSEGENVSACNDSEPRTALERCDQFVGRTVNWLYDHLVQLDRFRPVVLCNRFANRQEFPEIDAIKIEPTSLVRRAWRKLAGGRLYPSDAVRIDRTHPVILHSHFGDQGFEDLQLGKALHLPWFVAFYGADVYELGHQNEWKERYDAVFAQANKILALGPAMKQELETIGCPSEKVVVHPLGVDVGSLPSKTRVLEKERPLRVLFAGTFREKKGISYAVKALGELKRRGIKFRAYLVGDAAGKPGDEETKLSIFRLIRRLDLADHISHQSYLTFQALLKLALQCHVFLAPSVTAVDGDKEGTPFVLQQMMATEMPVIATRHSDIPFVFGDLHNSLIAERDSIAIADKLESYALNPDLLAKDGAQLRRQINDNFDVRQCANHLCDLYSSAL